MKVIKHREFSSEERKRLAAKGQAMPGGSYPITNRQQLKDAIQAYGRAKNKPAAKAWIIRRAKALGLTDLLPEKWVEHSMTLDEFLEHYGVKGMKWGVRRNRSGGSSTARTKFKKAPSKLSTEELTRRIKRMETEKKYNQLNRDDVSEGRQFVNDVLTTSGRRIATTVITGGGIVAIKAALNSKFGESVAKEATRRLK